MRLLPAPIETLVHAIEAEGYAFIALLTQSPDHGDEFPQIRQAAEQRVRTALALECDPAVRYEALCRVQAVWVRIEHILPPGSSR